MNSASLTFTELDTGELEMKLSFSGDEFNPNIIAHLGAAKAAEIMGKLLDKVHEEDTNESAE